MKTYYWDVLVTYHWDVIGCFIWVLFETSWRRTEGRRHYVPMRRHHDIPIKRREDVPLRRLGNLPLRRRWVFHLRRTCNVTETYREMSLQRRYDVLLPGGSFITFFIITFYKAFTKFRNIFKPFQVVYKQLLRHRLTI